MFQQIKNILYFLKYKVLRLLGKTSGQSLHAKVYYHFIGNGEWIKLRSSDISVEKPDFNLELFSYINFVKATEYKNQKYLYEDCLKESFVRNGHRVIIVHVRYLLDTEFVNFKSFVESLSPSDFISA